MENTELAYIAGIVDGEGSIAISRARRGGHTTYFVSVSVSNTVHWLLEWLKFNFGGCIVQLKKPPQQKEAWEWKLSRGPGMRFVKAILPYLLLKKAQADLAIKFQERKGPPGPKTDEEKALEEADWVLMHSYNKRGRPNGQGNPVASSGEYPETALETIHGAPLGGDEIVQP